MKLRFESINEENSNELHSLMTEYYRDAEDRDTPQEEIDEFIKMLCDMLEEKSIGGRLVYLNTEAVGFLLWMIDQLDSPFSEVPGNGTILEIGLASRYRHCGYGKELVDYAEEQMMKEGANGFYVLAYGPAHDFWNQCGYYDSKRKGKNNLPLLTKALAD